MSKIWEILLVKVPPLLRPGGANPGSFWTFHLALGDLGRKPQELLLNMG